MQLLDLFGIELLIIQARMAGVTTHPIDSDHGQGHNGNKAATAIDLPIKEAERKFFWPLGRRPDEHPGLSDLNL
jgi:hypothetical protein